MNIRRPEAASSLRAYEYRPHARIFVRVCTYTGMQRNKMQIQKINYNLHPRTPPLSPTMPPSLPQCFYSRLIVSWLGMSWLSPGRLGKFLCFRHLRPVVNPIRKNYLVPRERTGICNLSLSMGMTCPLNGSQRVDPLSCKSTHLMKTYPKPRSPWTLHRLNAVEC